MSITEYLGIHTEPKRKPFVDERVASYVAFTKEDPLTHEVSVFLGWHKKLGQKPEHWGFPGGGRDNGRFHLPWFHEETRSKIRLRWGGKENNSYRRHLSIHFSESPEDIARREIKEEIGIRIQRRDLVLAYTVVGHNPLDEKRDKKLDQFAYLFVAKDHPFTQETEIQGSEILHLRPFTLQDAHHAYVKGELTEEVFQGVAIAILYHRAHISRYSYTIDQLNSFWENVDKGILPQLPKADDNFR